MRESQSEPNMKMYENMDSVAGVRIPKPDSNRFGSQKHINGVFDLQHDCI